MPPPSQPPTDAAHPGLDPLRVSAWFERNVPEATLPLRFELVAAGGSNLTFRVDDDAGRRFVLRRPPQKVLLATAHDVAREHRILQALGDAGSDVAVPRTGPLCEDPEVTGAPFYVMDFVEGRILREQADASDMDAAACESATRSLVDTQIALHTLDIDAVGLGDLGRRGGYVARQLKRWRTQYERGGVRRLPLLEALHERLAGCIPDERTRPGLAHGDYRFDNTVLGPDFGIAAVLDWELCTVGDPIADFAWSMMYWSDPGDAFHFLRSPPTLHPAFMRRAEMVELYRRRSGFDLSDLPWFVAFSWWKMACIVEGVYGRARAGVRGGLQHSEGTEAIARRVEVMLEHAEQAARDLC